MWFNTRVEMVLRLFGPRVSISDYILLSMTQGVDSVSTLGWYWLVIIHRFSAGTQRSWISEGFWLIWVKWILLSLMLEFSVMLYFYELITLFWVTYLSILTLWLLKLDWIIYFFIFVRVRTYNLYIFYDWFKFLLLLGYLFVMFYH